MGQVWTRNVVFNPTNITQVSANYSAGLADREIDVTCSSGDITITLPDAVAVLSPGTGLFSLMYRIQKIDATVHQVIIAFSAGQGIGDPNSTLATYGSFALTSQNDLVEIYAMMSNGVGYWMVSHIEKATFAPGDPPNPT